MKTLVKSSQMPEFQPFAKGKDEMTNIAKSTQKQAFALTCLVFLPLLLLFVSFSKPFKIEMKGQDAISLAMAQFVASGEFVAPKLAPAPSPKQDKKTLTKERKQAINSGAQEKKETKEQEEQNLGGGAQVANAQPTQIGTLAYGKDDNPFLREIKAAIDKAAYNVIIYTFANADNTRADVSQNIQKSAAKSAFVSIAVCFVLAY